MKKCGRLESPCSTCEDKKESDFCSEESFVECVISHYISKLKTEKYKGNMDGLVEEVILPSFGHHETKELMVSLAKHIAKWY